MKLRTTYHRDGTASHEIDGRPATQAEVDAAFPPKRIGPTGRSQSGACWPMKSDALAVHPSQIKAALARNKKHGVAGVSYDPRDGRAVLADRGARRQLMRLEGVHDNNGGYGDDTGSHGGHLKPIPESPMLDPNDA